MPDKRISSDSRLRRQRPPSPFARRLFRQYLFRADDGHTAPGDAFRREPIGVVRYRDRVRVRSAVLADGQGRVARFDNVAAYTLVPLRELRGHSHARCCDVDVARVSAVAPGPYCCSLPRPGRRWRDRSRRRDSRLNRTIGAGGSGLPRQCAYRIVACVGLRRRCAFFAASMCMARGPQAVVAGRTNLAVRTSAAFGSRAPQRQSGTYVARVRAPPLQRMSALPDNDRK